MSIWISKLPLILLLVGAVAGCVVPGGGTTSVSILTGTISIPAPRGYCIDTAASQSGADSAVVIIGRCSDATDVPAAAITATVGEAGSAAVMAAGTEALSGYFASAEGRAALSRDGQADDVEIRDIRSADGVIILHLNDRAMGDYWRAVFGIRGRLVTLAVTPPDDQPLTEAEGKVLLDRAVGAIRAANPATAP